MLSASLNPLAALCLLCAPLVACAEAPAHPPPAPDLDGSIGSCPTGCPPPPTDGGPRDLGSSRDAGPRDGSTTGPLGGLCAGFPRAGSSVSAPVGFAPTSLVARWDRESCAVPELVIALTEGGCDLTSGERLELRFAEAGVTDGVITIGVNAIFSDGTHPLRLRYVSTGTPSATVGPCGVGTVDIDMLALTRDGRFVASFDVTLDDCDVFGDPGVSLVGTFDVPILESSADACP